MRRFLSDSWLVLVLGTAFSVALAAAQTALAPRTEANRQAALTRAVLEVVPGAVRYTERKVGLRSVYECFDAEGRPILLYLTSRGWEPGPKNAPYVWHTARWTGDEWEIRGSIQSDNNYDMGSLYVEPDGLWRIIAPTETGPQPYNPGGEVAMWLSKDQGRSWKKIKQLTHDSEFNHTYCRRPLDAHPDFYALWADGHGRKPSPSRLYFTNRNGDHVWRLPPTMSGRQAKPKIAW